MNILDCEYNPTGLYFPSVKFSSEPYFFYKHGVHFAQELSGNVSIKEIFRYAKPSQEELQSTIEGLFE